MNWVITYETFITKFKVKFYMWSAAIVTNLQTQIIVETPHNTLLRTDQALTIGYKFSKQHSKTEMLNQHLKGPRGDGHIFLMLYSTFKTLGSNTLNVGSSWIKSWMQHLDSVSGVL